MLMAWMGINAFTPKPAPKAPDAPVGITDAAAPAAALVAGVIDTAIVPTDDKLPEQQATIVVDVAAKRLGKDRVALRRLNLIASVPHVTSLGYRIDSGDFRAALAMGLKAADHAGFARRRAESRRRGLMRGLGIACFLETSRGEPDEQAFVRLADDGTLVLAVGTQSNGQGHETSFVQLVAARLGLPMAAFRYVQADTTQLPRGGGHGGARSLHMGGTALLLATDDLLRQALPLAAGLLQAAEADVTYADGAFRSGTPPRSIDLPGIGRALAQSGSGPRLAGRGDNVCDTYTFPNGCHVAEVEVDPETGTVALLRYCAFDDYGTLVNPLLAEGQIHGGLAQGIGQALMEQVTYDPESGQLASATFMDYAMPRAADVPPFEVRFVEIPTAANPIGAKGAGQAGAIAATPAVINAIVDALAPLGIDHFDMPATPQRVWQAIRDARLSLAPAPDLPGSGS
jgi:carbon-monoxide dehydrogenase large subunit